MKKDKPSIPELILSDARSWVIGKVLESMTEVIFEVKKTNELLGLVVNQPFHTGNDYLELAKNYLLGSNSFNTNLENARKYFQESANLMQGLDKAHSYYLAGICSDLLLDNVGKKFYFEKSYDVLVSFESSRIESSKDKADMAGTAAGAGTLIAGMIGGAFLPFAIPGIMIAGFVAYLANGVAVETKSQIKLYKGLEDEIYCPIPNTTWVQLKEALEKAQKSI
jgi:hypothetical protein